MPAFDEHLIVLKRLWNLTPETLDATRATTEAALAPDPGYVLMRFQELQMAGEGPEVVVAELAAMGPSVVVLLQLAQYLAFTDQAELALPDESCVATTVAVAEGCSETAAAASAHSPQPIVIMSQTNLCIAAFVLILHNVTRNQLEHTDIEKICGVPHAPGMDINTTYIMMVVLRHIFDSGIDEICCLAFSDDGPGLATLSRKDVSRMLNSLLNPLDQTMMKLGAVQVITMHAMRIAYALATDIDEVAVFAHGSVVLSLDDVLALMLEYSLQLPDCLFGLANQILQRRLQWRFMRGRLVNAYDLVAMIPDATALQELDEDPSEVAHRIDKAPRGRVPRFWRHSWMDVATSLLLIAGGVLAYKKANASVAS